jgi:beta-phosphoglucomutase-like phosphatase (HAD superfamily)
MSQMSTAHSEFSPENEGAVKMIPGEPDLFKALREADIKVCLNTGAPTSPIIEAICLVAFLAETGYPHSIADRLLQMIDLEDMIDRLLVAENVGMR